MTARTVSKSPLWMRPARILSPELLAGIDTGLVIGDEMDGVPWRVYTNERAAMHYRGYLARLDRKG